MKLSFVQKLWLPLGLSLSCLAWLSLHNAYDTREVRLEERKAGLAHATEIAFTVVKGYAALAASGAMPETEAKSRALEAVRNIRYGQNGYFTVFNSAPKILTHATKPEMIGKEVGDYKDLNGVYLYNESLVITKNGERGYSTYAFSKPGETKPTPKIAYNARYAPWDWSFQTGMYFDDLDAAFRASLYSSLALLAGLGAVLSLIVVLINRSVVHSIKNVTACAEALANGNLSLRVDASSDDEIGLLSKSVNDAAAQLASIVHGVKQASSSISTATRQLADGNADLSRRAEQQTSSLQQTASSIGQLTSTVSQNADNARQANDLAADASGLTVTGTAVVTRMVATIEEIRKGSVQISDITALIEGIAFQTNILALNAAVEAARAGEQGRGFAVVASEVRDLARRSSVAAKEIKTVIDSSVVLVHDGSSQAAQVGNTMGEIMQSIQRVSSIVGEIASASDEQRRGIEQVNAAVTQMDQLTQQNAALVEESAHAAHALNDEAGRLDRAVSVFQLGESAMPATSAAPATPATPATPAMLN
ncbi:MAG: methyl-accepting chemotaxis protein [Pseudomonadota bacterium]